LERFQPFFRKPLKRLISKESIRSDTRLKQGVNETEPTVTVSQQHGHAGAL
jgi:hypothetical protein